MEEKEVGRVTHFFSKPSVAAVDLSASLAVGDTIIIRGATTELEQELESMQIEHQDINEAEGGQAVAVRVKEKVRPGDVVYKK